jgi:hypothetical protein
MTTKSTSESTVEPLMQEALDAYGIKLDQVFKMGRRPEGRAGIPRVIIKTIGGVIVMYASGDEVVKLTEEQLNGRRSS